jgi:SnoaL-like domain
MESLAALRQLAYRYALAVDTRDLDDLVGLFVPDVRVGRDQTGRPALHEWFSATLRSSRMSIHTVANHIVDFDDADHARGIVYCHDQLERPQSATWDTGNLQYWDSYVRLNGEWFFERRRFYRWYLVDALTRPSHGAGVNDGGGPLRTGQLPDAFESWTRFWGGDP